MSIPMLMPMRMPGSIHVNVYGMEPSMGKLLADAGEKVCFDILLFTVSPPRQSALAFRHHGESGTASCR
jgi:hypothetical protein